MSYTLETVLYMILLLPQSSQTPNRACSHFFLFSSKLQVGIHEMNTHHFQPNDRTEPYLCLNSPFYFLMRFSALHHQLAQMGIERMITMGCEEIALEAEVFKHSFRLKSRSFPTKRFCMYISHSTPHNAYISLQISEL